MRLYSFTDEEEASEGKEGGVDGLMVWFLFSAFVCRRYGDRSHDGHGKSGIQFFWVCSIFLALEFTSSYINISYPDFDGDRVSHSSSLYLFGSRWGCICRSRG